MRDSRIDELLKHLGDVTDGGSPAPLALLAHEVVSNLNAISAERKRLEVCLTELEVAEAEAETLKKTLRERDSLREDIVNIIVDAKARGSLSSTSRGAHFRHNARDKRNGLVSYEEEYSGTVTRFKSVTLTIKMKRKEILARQDEIACLSDARETLLIKAGYPPPDDRPAPRLTPVTRKAASRRVYRKRNVARRSSRAA